MAMIMITMTILMMITTMMKPIAGGIQPSNADAAPSAATKEVMRLRQALDNGDDDDDEEEEEEEKEENDDATQQGRCSTISSNQER